MDTTATYANLNNNYYSLLTSLPTVHSLITTVDVVLFVYAAKLRIDYESGTYLRVCHERDDREADHTHRGLQSG